MSQKLPVISGKEAVKAFSRGGWHLDRIAGSHAVMRKEGSTVTLSVPLHPELRKGQAPLFDKGCRYQFRGIFDVLDCLRIISDSEIICTESCSAPRPTRSLPSWTRSFQLCWSGPYGANFRSNYQSIPCHLMLDYRFRAISKKRAV